MMAGIEVIYAGRGQILRPMVFSADKVPPYVPLIVHRDTEKVAEQKIFDDQDRARYLHQVRSHSEYKGGVM